jgi:Xaa-Pro aminopeptidase
VRASWSGRKCRGCASQLSKRLSRHVAEDESPYKLIAGILRDRGATGTIGIEERLRFFIYDGLRHELPGAQFVSATPVTAGCRISKSSAEIALMQQANDITLQAIGKTIKSLEAGMTNAQVAAFAAAQVGATCESVGRPRVDELRARQRDADPAGDVLQRRAIVRYGEFGIRLEDCLYVTESGPRFFTPQSPSIEQPV